MSQRFTFLSFYFPGKHYTLLIVLTVILLDNKSRNINFGEKKPYVPSGEFAHLHRLSSFFKKK